MENLGVSEDNISMLRQVNLIKKDPLAALEKCEMTEKQREAFKLAKNLREDPEKVVLEVLPAEQREQFKMAEEMYKNPVEASMNYLGASDMMKGHVMQAKGMYDDPYMIQQFVKENVPEEYRDLV